MNIDKLNKLVTRVTAMALYVPVISVVIIGALIYLLSQSHQTINRLVQEHPVYVVPGALAGQYKAGLNEETLINSARYWTGLLANYNRKQARERLGELENYADNTYLVSYQKLRDQTLAEVEQQSQGRTFIEMKDSAKVQREQDGSYTFKVRGERTFFSGGIVLYEDQADVTWRFKLGSPSEKNAYGLSFIGVNVSEVPGTKKTN